MATLSINPYVDIEFVCVVDTENSRMQIFKLRTGLEKGY
jgi:hypothetical protein